MNPESIEAGIVHIAMIGKDIKFNEREGLVNWFCHFKKLKRVCVLTVGEGTQSHRVYILLTSKTVDNKVLRRRVNLSTGRHRLGDVLHGKPRWDDRF